MTHHPGRKTLAAIIIGASLHYVIPATFMTTGIMSVAEAATARKEVGNPLAKAQELGKQKKFKEAIAEWKKAEAVSNKTAYESRLVNDIGAWLYMSSRDYATAAAMYEKSLPDVPAEQKAQRIKTLAQLNMQLKQWDKAQRYANQYSKEFGPAPDIDAMLVQSSYMKGDYATSARIASTLVSSAKKAGKTPSETDLQLLMSAWYKQNRPVETQAALTDLLRFYPKPNYWRDMYTFIASSPGKSDRTELETYRLKLAAGQLEPREYVAMAELAMAMGVPGEARKVLAAGVKAGTVAQGETKAREMRLIALAEQQVTADRAEFPAQVQAAKTDPKGTVAASLGEAYLSYGESQNAIAQFQDALTKGVSDKQTTTLHLALAQHDAGNTPEALKILRTIPNDGSRIGQIAALWDVVLSKR